MQFTPAGLDGAWVVDPDRLADARGFFARTWCEDEFRANGPCLDLTMVQASVSFNARAGTLRGMHYAVLPSREMKLVRCTRGAIYDVLLDLRPDSPTRLRHVAFELTALNHRALFIPAGVAHGFQTLSDDTEVFYQMSERFDPAHARGVRWNDPAFGIEWPEAGRTIHERDANYPDFRDERHD